MKIDQEKINKITKTFINEKFKKYLNKGIINVQYNKQNPKKENSYSQYSGLLSNMLFESTFGKYKKDDIKLIRSFFIFIIKIKIHL